ncbi:MAG: hypothetical protein JOZ69_20535, partial [Myxococcales bacterium]|nr:hypothetical protein [Myxococcales bacterium]
AGQPGGAGSVDGTLAAAHFSEPWVIAGDGRGHLYVADLHVIRAIDVVAGTVTTLAGDPRRPGAVDGRGPAALFNTPCGLAYKDGELYVADTENHAIRRIDVGTGAVTTVAGALAAPGAVDGVGSAARFREPEGLAFDPRGDLYIGDTDNNTLRVYSLETGAVRTLAGTPDTAGTADGVGPAARFNKPKGLTLDGAGNLYVIDGVNLSVRRVVIASAAVSTLARFGSLPQGLAVVGGDLLVSLAENRVVRVAPDGSVEALAGSGAPRGSFADGPFATAGFRSPAGMLFDGSGTVFLADLGNAAVRALSLADATVRTFAGARSAGADDGPAAAARFASPEGLAAAGDAVFVADSANHALRRVALSSGEVTTLSGAALEPKLVDGALHEARFHHPSGLALDAARDLLYVADTQNRVIRRVDLRAGQVITLALERAPGDPFVAFDAPTGLTLEGGRLFATDYTEHVVLAIDPANKRVSTLAGTYGVPGRADGKATAAAFYGPIGIAGDGHGHLFVADDLNQTVRRIDADTGAVTTVAGRAVTPGAVDGAGAGARFHFPMGIAADGYGEVFVADSFNHSVRRIDLASSQVTTLAGSPETPGVKLGPLPAQLTKPAALALTPSGGLLVTSENAVLVAR